jgi:hypothetical protein
MQRMTDIFVFGSNLQGHHGAGAAKFAMENHGAGWGEGVGRTGNSYAIPTMMSLELIRPHIDVFIDYAANHKGDHFNLTRIGTGIAGYDWDRDIRPMFPDVMPSNITILEPI